MRKPAKNKKGAQAAHTKPHARVYKPPKPPVRTYPRPPVELRRVLDWRPRFLWYLAALGGNLWRAAEAAKVTRRVVYDALEREPMFKAAFDQAVREGTEMAEAELIRRAVDGVDEPVYQQGRLCGFIRKFDSNLLMFLLRSRDPKYKDKGADIWNVDLRSMNVQWTREDLKAIEAGEPFSQVLVKRLAREMVQAQQQIDRQSPAIETTASEVTT